MKAERVVLLLMMLMVSAAILVVLQYAWRPLGWWDYGSLAELSCILVLFLVMFQRGW